MSERQEPGRGGWGELKSAPGLCSLSASPPAALAWRDSLTCPGCSGAVSLNRVILRTTASAPRSQRPKPAYECGACAAAASRQKRGPTCSAGANVQRGGQRAARGPAPFGRLWELVQLLAEGDRDGGQAAARISPERRLSFPSCLFAPLLNSRQIVSTRDNLPQKVVGK